MVNVVFIYERDKLTYLPVYGWLGDLMKAWERVYQRGLAIRETEYSVICKLAFLQLSMQGNS